jgi:hypothetical protein
MAPAMPRSAPTSPSPNGHENGTPPYAGQEATTSPRLGQLAAFGMPATAGAGAEAPSVAGGTPANSVAEWPAEDSADTARVGPTPPESTPLAAGWRNSPRGRLLVMAGSAVALLAFILVGGSMLIFGNAIGSGEPVGGNQAPRPGNSASPSTPPSDPPATPSVAPSTSDGAGTGDLSGPANNGSNNGSGTGNGNGKGGKSKNNNGNGNGNGNRNPSYPAPDMPSFPAFPPFPTPTFDFPPPPSFPTYP